jgi:ADP-ribosylglycohydrolase
MLGAIIGDIVGSPWEFRRIKTKDFPLFGDRNGITDDTILTIAVADALMNARDPAESLRDWARRVKPGKHVAGYGKKFINWVAAPTVQPPYGSLGNGGAMRVSPAAFLARKLDDCLDMARQVTEITHNHPEGLRGALAMAHAIFLALDGQNAPAIRTAIVETYGYDLSRSVDEIRVVHEYNETALGCVPEALTCALDSTNYEDAIRNAVSLGGDADTLAAIAGGLAEALFGIPDDLQEAGMDYLPESMKEILADMYRSRGESGSTAVLASDPAG